MCVPTVEAALVGGALAWVLAEALLAAAAFVGVAAASWSSLRPPAAAPLPVPAPPLLFAALEPLPAAVLALTCARHRRLAMEDITSTYIAPRR